MSIGDKMKKKIIIAIIIILLLISGVVTTIILLNNKDDDKKKKKEETKTEYKLLENGNIKYAYISSYKAYTKLMEDEKITKSDDYVAYSKDDFKDQKYLFVILPYDYCSESITNDKLEKDGNKYKVLLDVSYTCGLCPLAKKVLGYKVEETDLKVEVYTKEVSHETCDPNVAYKPIIYVYPEQDMDLNITLGNKDDLLYTYPKYNNGWNVHVTKDGNIYDYNTKRNYYGLYWEGKDSYQLDMSEGFVVKGSDTVKFLEEKLAILGLNDYEINEFIIYWIDKMESNNYNFISFRKQEDMMPITFSKNPDTLIRVMMDFKPLDKKMNVKEQKLTKVTRKGYTIVEWGGTKH